MPRSPSSSFHTRWSIHGVARLRRPSPRTRSASRAGGDTARACTAGASSVARLARQLVRPASVACRRIGVARALDDQLVALAADRAERAVRVDEREPVVARGSSPGGRDARFSTTSTLLTATSAAKHARRRSGGRARGSARAPAARRASASRSRAARSRRSSRRRSSASTGTSVSQLRNARLPLAISDDLERDHRARRRPAAARRGPNTNHGSDQLDDVVEHDADRVHRVRQVVEPRPTADSGSAASRSAHRGTSARASTDRRAA